MREIIFDTETTGLSAGSGDRLVEIGCIELINRVETGRKYHAYFNPQRKMPADAQAVHGLTDRFLADKPLFADKADELMAFLGSDTPLVAHNASFDFGFLNVELAMAGRKTISLDRMIDTQAIARRLHPGAKHNLDAMCTRYGIDRSHRLQHGALLDAELLAQLYIEMMGGRQIGMFTPPARHDPIAAVISAEVHSVDVSIAVVRRPFRKPRPHLPSAEELARHEAFIATIDKAIWLDTV